MIPVAEVAVLEK